MFSGNLLRTILVGVVVLIPSIGSATSACAPLFDGKSLAGWTRIGGQPGNWRSEDGLLVTIGDGKDWLSTNREFSDFEVRLEYRTGPAGNSGLLLRAPHRGDPSFEGLEIQILDDSAPAYRNLRPDQYSGSVYGLLAAKRGATRPSGAWNSLQVRARGSRIQVQLNGIDVVDGDLSTRSDATTRHPGLARTSGFLGLQSHGDPIQFRRITIEELRNDRESAPSPTVGG